MGRLSRNIIKANQSDNYENSFGLEEDKSAARPMPAEGAQAITHFNFRYVMIYPASTRPEVVEYGMKSLPLEEIAKDESIHLYRVSSSPRS